MILTIGIVSVAVVFALAFILNSVFLMRDYVEGLDHFDKQTYWSFIGGDGVFLYLSFSIGYAAQYPVSGAN